MNLPNELTEFIPENVILGPVRSWEPKVDEFGDNIEIHNAVLSSPMKTGIAIMVIAMMLFFSCFVGIFAVFGGAPWWILLLVGGVASIPCCIGAGGAVASWLYEASANASLWKGTIRWRYDKTSGELFFAREHVHYSRDDYDDLILGMTDGYDTIKMAKEETIVHITQSYFLVHRKDGAWIRHMIGYDQCLRSTRRAVEKIQKAMQCWTVKRTMSLQECYTTQRKTVSTTLEQTTVPCTPSEAILSPP
jgi:hypothetical protein